MEEYTTYHGRAQSQSQSSRVVQLILEQETLSRTWRTANQFGVRCHVRDYGQKYLDRSSGYQLFRSVSTELSGISHVQPLIHSTVILETWVCKSWL